MHNPEKKDSTIFAIAEGAILGFSASIFIARRRFNSARFSVTTPISLIRKDSELPHRVDGKAPLLFPLVERTILKESLNVVPAQRLLGEKPSLLLAPEAMPKARHKKIFLVSELGVQP
jgi:hypothetical protein